jgi:DNA mismatch repair protein MSH6
MYRVISLSLIYSFPVKSSSRASSDDDDFIVPDDSEEDASSTRKTSSRRSSVSSRRSTASENDDFEEDALDLEEKPKKTKAKGKGKAASKSNTAGDAGGTFGFLTAAEQRAQGKKEEKKAAEEAYSFLQDVRDVSSACRRMTRTHLFSEK